VEQLPLLLLAPHLLQLPSLHLLLCALALPMPPLPPPLLVRLLPPLLLTTR
jgi:hypothetical protein